MNEPVDLEFTDRSIVDLRHSIAMARRRLRDRLKGIADEAGTAHCHDIEAAIYNSVLGAFFATDCDCMRMLPLEDLCPGLNRLEPGSGLLAGREGA